MISGIVGKAVTELFPYLKSNRKYHWRNGMIEIAYNAAFSVNYDNLIISSPFMMSTCVP